MKEQNRAWSKAREAHKRADAKLQSFIKINVVPEQHKNFDMILNEYCFTRDQLIKETKNL